MSSDEKRRQRQLAKRAAKRKAIKKEHALMSSASPTSLTKQVMLASQAPVHECLLPIGLFELGMGNVMISRKLPDGRIALSAFLVDAFCLGVKNAFFRIVTEYEYKFALETNMVGSQPDGSKQIEPACLRKLIEQAVAYARDLGFEPHPDYNLARLIFGDIDPSACNQNFTFGSQGKPFYIAGPNESSSQIRVILQTLEKRCGPDGYHYMLPVG